MSESNNVYENFEDALFRLFMDRVAVVEGERLLRENEELKSDPDAAVPRTYKKDVLQLSKKASSGVIEKPPEKQRGESRVCCRSWPSSHS